MSKRKGKSVINIIFFPFLFLQNQNVTKAINNLSFCLSLTIKHYKSDFFYAVSTLFLIKVWKITILIIHLWRKPKVLVWRMTVEV